MFAPAETVLESTQKVNEALPESLKTFFVTADEWDER